MVEAIRQGDIPGVQLRCRRVIGCDPEQLWSWFSEAGRLERWIADSVRLDHGAKGGPVLELLGDSEPYLRERGETLVLEAPRRWVLSFERLDNGWTLPTRLTFRLRRNPGGSEADLLHEGFERLPLSIGLTVWEQYRLRWRAALDRLAQAVAAGD